MGQVHEDQRGLLRVLSATDELLANARASAGQLAVGDLPAPPVHRVAVVTCMDARLSPRTLLGLSEGDAHIIRNAGGVVTDDVIRSLAFSQHMMGTREVMLIKHTNCGLQKATDGDLVALLPERPPWSPLTFDDLDESVRTSVRTLRDSPFLRETVSVRGFVFEIETGRLREVDCDD